MEMYYTAGTFSRVLLCAYLLDCTAIQLGQHRSWMSGAK